MPINHLPSGRINATKMGRGRQWRHLDQTREAGSGQGQGRALEAVVSELSSAGGEAVGTGSR